jgi:hypothetical protein
MKFLALTFAVCLTFLSGTLAEEPAKSRELSISWEKNYLTISGEHVPGKVVRVLYLEAYCRPDAHEADWVKHTVVGHKTELVSASEDGKRIELKCILNDGVTVHHLITAKAEEVDFRLTAKNPTDKASETHWAQPCIRVGEFTGLGDPQKPQTYEYLKKSFVFLDGKLSLMPTKDWAKEARYVPGQVWRAPNVPGKDVNPRPLNPHVPSNGIIGCFSGDNRWILASVWEPYHELFQGVITCVHSDFRIGGLKPGETKAIRGKIYLVPNDVEALLQRYEKDFPEHAELHGKPGT